MQNNIKIYVKGKAFSDDGFYDLRILENIISNHRKIFDRIISANLGKTQTDRNFKNNIKYQAQIKSGSIQLLIDFILEHKELIAALSPDAANVLSELTIRLLRDAISLRKKAADLIKKGVAININISNSFNMGSTFNTENNISIDNNTGTISISDPRILLAAQATRNPINEILSAVDGENIEYIDLSSSSDRFRLLPEDRKIMGQHKEVLPTTITIIGRLDMVAFTAHRGIIISENGRFNVTWDETVRSKMQRLGDIDGVIFSARPVIDRKRLDSSAIGFHVLDCYDPQTKFFG